MRASARERFVHINPTQDAYWRAIILFGRNVASYKFALGKALLEVAGQGQTTVTLADVAGPFARTICAHLQHAPRQVTSSQSQFLNACRQYNEGTLPWEQLLTVTQKRGFVNVIDAFHVVGDTEVGHRFFEDDRRGGGGLILTETLHQLAASPERDSLAGELEARWRLVETAWNLQLAPRLLVIQHDPTANALFLTPPSRARIDVTSCRDALNGYQKGRCFYCFRPIRHDGLPETAPDVDHLFPVVLQRAFPQINLNGVWNLVLSCRTCNRGAGGERDRLPALKYVERLHHRNAYLIDSHHPLRETLMAQLGPRELDRRVTLQAIDREAVAARGQREQDRWVARDDSEAELF